MTSGTFAPICGFSDSEKPGQNFTHKEASQLIVCSIPYTIGKMCSWYVSDKLKL